MKRFVLSFAACMNLLLLDQFVKAASVSSLKGPPVRSVNIIPNIFDLTYVENRGCAWGMFQGHVWPLAVFAIIAGALLIWKRKTIFPKGKIGVVTELLLYSGILGNLVDRIALGYVVDMFHFHWYSHSFPVFNIADVFICVAAGLLVLSSCFEKKAEEKKAEAQAK